MFDGLDNDVQVLLVCPSDILRWAERIRPHVEKMAEASSGRYETADIFAALAAGRMILWPVVEGIELACVLLTEIVQYPRRRAMRMVGISGYRARRWMHLLADVERASCERFGCDLMEALHQRGHGRMLCTDGWHEFHVLSEKVL